MKRLVSIGNFFGAHKPFKQLFDETIVVQLEDFFEFEPDDVVLFGGGADISPTIYNHSVSTFTGASAHLSFRDSNEVRHFRQAVKTGCGIIGICRGAQLACAMSGGSLIQHVDNHSGGDHTMKTHDGRVIMVSSVHHQMMNPENTAHEILGVSEDILSERHIVQGNVNIDGSWVHPKALR